VDAAREYELPSHQLGEESDEEDDGKAAELDGGGEVTIPYRDIEEGSSPRIPAG